MSETDKKTDKKKAINTTLASIEKRFGQGAIMRLGDKPKLDFPSISTGALTLDLATGIGGVPRGRITEIYGPEASGKTTLTLSIIAECQKSGGTCAFVDAEHALDPEYASNIGIDVDELIISQPSHGEEALEIVETLVSSGEFDLIVVDSVAALIPKSELDNDMGSATMGVQARLMSQACRKLTAIINKTNTALIFINQVRMKIGVMYGSPETTTGGMALKFYSSMRLEIRRKESLKKGDEVYGNLVKVKVTKNKLAPPFRKTEFEIIFGKGINSTGDLVSAALNEGIVGRKGTYYFYNDDRIAQGKEATIQELISNPKLFEQVKSDLMSLISKKEEDKNKDDKKKKTKNTKQESDE